MHWARKLVAYRTMNKTRWRCLQEPDRFGLLLCFRVAVGTPWKMPLAYAFLAAPQRVFGHCCQMMLCG